MIFQFECDILPDWIDYNGHMRDSYYGLVFSLAVDALQDEVGFDQAYRDRTGCTIYLLEGHTFFLREVTEGQRVLVETRVVGVDAKRFHLHMTMTEKGNVVSVGEVMEAHVQQTPKPHTCPMPESIAGRLRTHCLTNEEIAALPHRARAMGQRR